MFDFFRVAGLAALGLGVAGASGNAVPAFAEARVEMSALPTPELPIAEPLLAVAAPELTPELVAEVLAEPETAPPTTAATTLTALVRRHGSTKTTDQEQECLAGAIYFESKGEPLEGQLAVANVILNRASSGRFARTACGVVMQRGQFSFVRSGSMPPIARSGSHWRTAVAIAHIATNDLWTPLASKALFFHARRVSPGWRLTRVASVGNHVFYR